MTFQFETARSSETSVSYHTTQQTSTWSSGHLAKCHWWLMPFENESHFLVALTVLGIEQRWGSISANDGWSVGGGGVGRREQVVIFNRPLQMKATGGSGPIISIWGRADSLNIWKHSMAPECLIGHLHSLGQTREEVPRPRMRIVCHTRRMILLPYHSRVEIELNSFTTLPIMNHIPGLSGDLQCSTGFNVMRLAVSSSGLLQ
jgi:hypothetical protein